MYHVRGAGAGARTGSKEGMREGEISCDADADGMHSKTRHEVR
jgi:hypothetical protein